MTEALQALAPLAAGTRALVLGLGRTGLSAARYLDRKGLSVRVADTRVNPPGVDLLRADVPAAELRTGTFSSSLLDDVAQVVISPGLSLQEPVVRAARERGCPVVGDIELFAREAPAPIAAITGTELGAEEPLADWERELLEKKDAVEIAHRHHRPLGDGGCGRGVANNGKARRHFAGFFRARSAGAGP